MKKETKDRDNAITSLKESLEMLRSQIDQVATKSWTADKAGGNGSSGFGTDLAVGRLSSGVEIDDSIMAADGKEDGPATFAAFALSVNEFKKEYPYVKELAFASTIVGVFWQSV